jgi:hypothetical protein
MKNILCLKYDHFSKDAYGRSWTLILVRMLIFGWTLMEREIYFDSLNSLTRNKEMIEYFQTQIFI